VPQPAEANTSASASASVRKPSNGSSSGTLVSAAVTPASRVSATDSSRWKLSVSAVTFRSADRSRAASLRDRARVTWLIVKRVEGGKKGGLDRPRVNSVSEALPARFDLIEEGEPSVHLSKLGGREGGDFVGGLGEQVEDHLFDWVTGERMTLFPVRSTFF
jgi:hypothetical protein